MPKSFYRRNLPHLQRDYKPHFLTFCTYQRWTLPDWARTIVLNSCTHNNQIRFDLHAVVVMPDHVHLLVTYPPKVSVSRLVNSLKGVSSRMIRKKNDPGIRKKLWGSALWSPSYFAGSCGGAPIAVIRQYIEQQQTPH